MGRRREERPTVNRRSYLSLTLLLLAASTPLAAQPQWTILAYLDARGGLTQAAAHYERELATAAHQQGLNLATMVLPDQPDRATASQCLTRARGTPSASEVALGPVQDGEVVLSTFLLTATQQLPARHYALLIMGHGTGLPRAAAGEATALRPQALRRGLAQAVKELGRPLDVLGLDACFGANVETAYELRDSCRLLTAAPGLIYSPGLRWAKALADSVDPSALVKALVAGGMPRGEQPVALVGVDMDRMAPLAEALRRLTDELRADLPRLAPTLTYARSKSRSWGDRAELCDLGELARGLAENAPDEGLRQKAEAVTLELERAVVARWWSGKAPAGAAAIGIYFPPTLEEMPAAYNDGFDLATQSGWSGLLEAYWARMAGLVDGGAIH